MTIHYSSDQQLFAVAEIDAEKADFVDMKSPGAISLHFAAEHVDEIGIAELAMLAPQSSAYFGSPRPNSEALAGYYSVGRSLLGAHGGID